MAIERVKPAIQSRAEERFEHEPADYEQKVARREAYETQTGQKVCGKEPSPSQPGPQPKDRVILWTAERDPGGGQTRFWSSR